MCGGNWVEPAEGVVATSGKTSGACAYVVEDVAAFVVAPGEEEEEEEEGLVVEEATLGAAVVADGVVALGEVLAQDEMEG